MSVGGYGPGGHKKEGFRLESRQRPYTLDDPERRINEIAVVQIEPRSPVLVLSFSSPQARILDPNYRFMWFEGETLKDQDRQKLTLPVLSDPRRLFHTFAILTDTDSVIDEAVLVRGNDQQVANFSFRDRWIAVHLPQYTLEWTAGVSIADAAQDKRLIMPPGALG